jgi:hypothetical protein
MARSRFVVVYPSSADVNAFWVAWEESTSTSMALGPIAIRGTTELIQENQAAVIVSDMGHAIFLLAEGLVKGYLKVES